MKKLKFLLTLLLGFLMTATSLFAGSLDYLSNQSARFMVTPSRNAATDYADAVAYNPAGTAFMPQGFHVEFSSQTLFKYYSQDAKMPAIAFDKELKQDTPTPSLPNLYLVYNFGEMGPGKLAVYAEVGVTAGGGDLEWNNGTAGTTLALVGIGMSNQWVANSLTPIGPAVTQSFKASSMYLTGGLGAAYAFMDDKVSLSVGGRYVYADRGFELDATYAGGYGISGEYEYQATGITPVIGIDVKPITGLTLAARYEHETELKFKYDQKRMNATGPTPTAGGTLGAITNGALALAGITDGKKVKQNLPQIIGLGADYQVNDELSVTISSTIYLLSQANMSGVEDYFNTGWEVGLGAKYNVTKELQLGLGTIYTESGAKKSYLNSSATALNASANPMLDSISIGIGGTYVLEDLGLDFSVGLLWSHYLPESFSLVEGISGEYRKDVYAFGVGVGYSM